MRAIQEFLNVSNDVTYEEYCAVLDNLHDPVLLEAFRGTVAKLSLRFVRDIKNVTNQIARDTKLNASDIVRSFKQRSVFGILKSFGFSIRLMLKALNELGGLIRRGLFSIFQELSKTKTFQKIRRGAIKVDEVIKRHPLLAKVTGIVIAGLLLFIWLNMTFIGELDYDFNFSDMGAALAGKFSIEELFVSPSGMMLLTMFTSGAVFGLSCPWLGKKAYNLILALVYTSHKKLKEKKVVPKIKRKLKTMRILK